MPPKKMTRQFSMSLKRAANPYDVFLSYNEEHVDFPGAVAADVCESGYSVLPTFGFDFGPLLTFGAPVGLDASVEAGIGGTMTKIMVFALAQQPSAESPVAFMQFGGWKFKAQVTAKSRIGFELPETITCYATDPLNIARKDATKNWAKEEGDKVVVKVRQQAGMKAKNKTENNDKPRSKKLEPGWLKVGGAVEAQASIEYQYMLIRDPDPSYFKSADDTALKSASDAIVSSASKTALKGRAVEILKQHSLGSYDATLLSQNRFMALRDKLKTIADGLRSDKDHKASSADQKTADQKAADQKTLQLSDEVEDYLTLVRAKTILDTLANRYGDNDLTYTNTTVVASVRRDHVPFKRTSELEKLGIALRTAARKLPDYGSRLNGQAVVISELLEEFKAIPKDKGAQEKADWKGKAKEVIQGAAIPSIQFSKLKREELKNSLDALSALTKYHANVTGEQDKSKYKRAEVWAREMLERYNRRIGKGPSQTNVETFAAWKDDLDKRLQQWVELRVNDYSFDKDLPLIKHPSANQLREALDKAKGSGVLAPDVRSEVDDIIPRLLALTKIEKAEVKRAAQAFLAGKKDSDGAKQKKSDELYKALEKFTNDPQAIELRERLEPFRNEDDPLKDSRVAQLCYILVAGPASGADVMANGAIGPASGRATAAITGQWSNTRFQTVFHLPTVNDPLVVQTQDTYLASWAADASLTLKTPGNSVSGGMVEWRCATVRWEYPKDTLDKTKVAVPLAGSGLSFGCTTTVKVLLAIARNAVDDETPNAKKSLAEALGFSPDRLAESLQGLQLALASTDIDPTDVTHSADDVVVYIEATHALKKKADGPSLTFLLAQQPRETKLGKSTEEGPIYDIEELRTPMRAAFEESSAESFALERVTVSLRDSSSLDQSKSFEQRVGSVFYVRIAITKVDQATRIGMCPIFTWWADEKSQIVENDKSHLERQLLRKDAVPPTFLLEF